MLSCKDARSKKSVEAHQSPSAVIRGIRASWIYIRSDFSPWPVIGVSVAKSLALTSGLDTDSIGEEEAQPNGGILFWKSTYLLTLFDGIDLLTTKIVMRIDKVQWIMFDSTWNHDWITVVSVLSHAHCSFCNWSHYGIRQLITQTDKVRARPF